MGEGKFDFRGHSEESLEFVFVAEIGELPEGERLLLEIDGQPIALFNTEGDVYAIADVCSHDDGPVAEGELEGWCLSCPRHGAQFDLRTGKALTLPAVVDIPVYPVRVEGEQILVGLPIE
jgi:3-phenylpropionate/trans-cinnamate dioxygenase ferredoxin subunit